jgi:alginate O-acetyltransferase complex protein AlgI
MVFSSVTFLYYFLPIVLLGYYLQPSRTKNIFLLFASLFFYAWGEVTYVLVLAFSIMANFGIGMLLESRTTASARRGALVFGLMVNVFLITYFKYAGFIFDNIRWALGHLGIPSSTAMDIHLPLGISFFTFQAMSYLVDVYRGATPAERNPLNLGLYISLFPQLVAGPIVRFHEVADQLRNRSHGPELFVAGVRRFVVGLGQKCLIANALALPADTIFSIPSERMTTGLAWLGCLSYTMQIYYDFAGYSNMAIGLGLMFGFRLPENFNYPYISRSITEFWKRWHMSLSGWFRDYLYIPLGGNRNGNGRTYRNLIIVFFLCGLWHGASWTFIIWGLYHGAFLVFERVGLLRFTRSKWAPVKHLYALLVVCVGWVFFRSSDLVYAEKFIEAMAGFSKGDGVVHSVEMYLTMDVYVGFLLAILGAGPLVPYLRDRFLRGTDTHGVQRRMSRSLAVGAEAVALAGILIAVAMNLAANTHNPFIYFRF